MQRSKPRHIPAANLDILRGINSNRIYSTPLITARQLDAAATSSSSATPATPSKAIATCPTSEPASASWEYCFRNDTDRLGAATRLRLREDTE